MGFLHMHIYFKCPRLFKKHLKMNILKIHGRTFMSSLKVRLINITLLKATPNKIYKKILI